MVARILHPALGLIVLAGALAGCRGNPAPVGRSIEGTYLFGTLSAEVPDGVPAIAAAADLALRSRGYAITERSITEDSARLIARPNRPGPLERIVVEAELSGEGSRIEVSCHPLGDEEASLAIMDALLARLGR